MEGIEESIRDSVDQVQEIASLLAECRRDSCIERIHLIEVVVGVWLIEIEFRFHIGIQDAQHGGDVIAESIKKSLILLFINSQTRACGRID